MFHWLRNEETKYIFLYEITPIYVYILTTKNKTVLYTGVTNDIKRRVFEHKSELYEGFTKKYHVHKLIYYELFDFIDLATQKRESLMNDFYA